LEKWAIVLDVGKTLSKLTLWNESGSLVDRRTYANQLRRADGYVALDTAGIEAWAANALSDFAKLGPIGALIPVGHGAGAAILRHGRLACPPMDYESPVSNRNRADYDRFRDPFDLTGSPPLPKGLNLGVQFHRLERLGFGPSRGDLIVPWAQYWAWVFSGVATSEVSSLGCHTDLWQPNAGQLSPMAVKRGWAGLLAPIRRADEALGWILPDWADRTGLPRDVRVYCGLHDSNAALLAARGFSETAERDVTVISTGTWFVAMRSGAAFDPREIPRLTAGRDCLMNVDTLGKTVPSARFMGGREIEILSAEEGRGVAANGGARAQAMVLPTFVPGVGPFPAARGRWVNMPKDPAARDAAIALYAALVTDVSLDLIGARDRIVIEGRFAENETYARALAAIRPQDEIYISHGQDGVAFGALRLVDPALAPKSRLTRVAPAVDDLEAYKSLWRQRCDEAAS
jgi:sugar (pentulose or hexulose) kinase